MSGANGAALAEARMDSHLAAIDQIGFQRLIEHIADGILVVDPSGAVLFANPAAAEIFGLPPEKLVSVPLGRPLVSGETADITVHRAGRRAAEVEMRVVEIAWEGQVALLASLRDISARRALEERQRQSQKMEATGRMAAGIVHDFNNLLAVFESGLTLLKKQLSSYPPNEKIETLFEELSNRAKNGKAITQQLLALSRQQPLAPGIVNVNERIESLSTLLRQALGSGVQIEMELDKTVGPVHIDANQLDVAILNLAINAKDAMNERGTLFIETSHTAFGIEDVPPAGSFVRVTVRDTGCGMSKDVLAQVFEPFFTTKSEGKGTGLGLSQVYGFINQSGGHVRIKSEVGRGTSVHLLLPRAQKVP